MAKKQSAEAATSPDKPAPAAEGSAPEGKEGKKAKEPKAKAQREKTAPAAPAGEAPPAVTPAPAATAPVEGATAAPTAPAPGEPAKKRGKRPGISPPRGKKLKNHLKNQRQKLSKEGPAPLKRAIGVLKQMKRSKFDETVEIHMSLGVDTTQSDQLVRGTVSLPHGIGKTVRVLVFCQGDNLAKAKGAGADYAGSDDLIKQIQGGWTDFDVALATQDMMGQVSRLGKVLGPRGLMPTPKAGTVIPATGDVSAAVREFKAGKVEYRTDKGGNVHAGVGKLSFDDDKLADNITAFVEQVRSVKPAGVKGNYVKSITVTSTMGPGIPVIV
jgi:large subunit ribosomal protein L1